jgi:hypothetical protein
VDFSSYSFLLEAPGIRVGHSADIGAPEDLAPLLTRPLDLLVCELAHFAPEALFKFLSGRDIRRIVFVHLAQKYRANLADVKKSARRMLPGVTLSFPRDGEVINFGL